MIVAMADNRVIGMGGKIPWRVPTDMRHFVELTAGHPVIMGRKTYQSIPKKYRPLDKGRTNIVMTRHPSQVDFDTEGTILASSPVEALAEAIIHDEEVVFIAGGHDIYELFLPEVSTIFLTRVCAQVEGDAFFPELPDNTWKLVDQCKKTQCENDQFPVIFEIWVRR